MIFIHPDVQEMFIEHDDIPGPVLLAGEIPMSKKGPRFHPPGASILMGSQL